jgi:nitroreductase
MLDSDLYPYIFKRKSIRRYADAPLSAEQTDMVQAALGSLVPLFPDEKYKLKFSREKRRVYAYCENSVTGNANIGFLLQQLDLALHGLGFGRLWFGTGREPRDVKPAPPLSYAICLKLGSPAEPLSRESEAEFDRKPIGEVIADADLQPVFKAVRLAPSAANTHPWRFVRDGDSIRAYRKKPGFVKAAMFGRMNQGDMGIALCHAVLALEHAGYAVRGISAEIPGTVPEGYEYTASIQISPL